MVGVWGSALPLGVPRLFPDLQVARIVRCVVLQVRAFVVCLLLLASPVTTRTLSHIYSVCLLGHSTWPRLTSGVSYEDVGLGWRGVLTVDNKRNNTTQQQRQHNE